eukprot:346147-Pleurochrysis_carterae.AAC.1
MQDSKRQARSAAPSAEGVSWNLHVCADPSGRRGFARGATERGRFPGFVTQRARAARVQPPRVAQSRPRACDHAGANDFEFRPCAQRPQSSLLVASAYPVRRIRT